MNMNEKLNYCHYNNDGNVYKYNNLKYMNYYTEIEGNTFIIYTYIYDGFRKHRSTKHKIVILPMCVMHLLTILEVLRAWNFNVFYTWIDDDYKAELKRIGN